MRINPEGAKSIREAFCGSNCDVLGNDFYITITIIIILLIMLIYYTSSD